MKTTGILIFIVCFHNFILGQNSSTHSKYCTLDYSGSQWVITHTDSAHQSCNALLIKTVPPATNPYTPIDMSMTIKGIYSFKKDPSLEIHQDYEVVIEDLLTGQYYDLNSPESYTFRVNRVYEKRFVLEINKKSQKPGNGSTASR